MQMSVLVLCSCVAAIVMVPLDQCEATPSPIVLIPGLMGSQLKVKDNQGHTNFASRFCETGRKFKELWVSPWRLAVHNVCAKRELPLVYNANTNSFHDNKKVTIKVPGFGDTSSVEYLNPGLIDTVEYLHDLVEYFVDRGYKRGQSIRAAPYDWRLAADELEKRGYYHQLKTMIEDMYNDNRRTKVTLVVHSMGGLVSLHFLTGFSGINQAWKDKYIHAYITVAAAWSGGVVTLQTVISGAHDVPDLLLFASNLINNYIVPITRTFESLPWLFPKAEVLGNTALISTPSKDYTANDYEELFSKVGYTNGYRFFQGVQQLVTNYPAPNVPTYCFYGDKVKTPRKFTYSRDFDGRTSTIGWEPKITNGDGDGTVNIESSRVCLRWSSMPSRYPLRYRVFDNSGHTSILKEKRVLDEMRKIVGAPKKKKKKSFLRRVSGWFG